MVNDVYGYLNFIICPHVYTYPIITLWLFNIAREHHHLKFGKSSGCLSHIYIYKWTSFHSYVKYPVWVILIINSMGWLKRQFSAEKPWSSHGKLDGLSSLIDDDSCTSNGPILWCIYPHDLFMVMVNDQWFIYSYHWCIRIDGYSHDLSVYLSNEWFIGSWSIPL